MCSLTESPLIELPGAASHPRLSPIGRILLRSGNAYRRGLPELIAMTARRHGASFTFRIATWNAAQFVWGNWFSVTATIRK